MKSFIIVFRTAITFLIILISFAGFGQSGAIDPTFNAADFGFGNGDGAVNGMGTSGIVRTSAIQNDGKIIIGGNFTIYNYILNSRNRIARLNVDGSLDMNFNPGTGADGNVYTSAIQSNGKIWIGGGFTSYNGIPRNGIVRINDDGTLDTGFEPGTGADAIIYSSSLQSDGKIFICGDFTTYNGFVTNRIARLNGDGTLDASFDPGIGADGIIYSSTLQSDGKILIGGNFTSYNGSARSRIARLNSDGTLDAGFDPGAGANFAINTMTILNDGKIIIGGAFTNYNGTAINRIARLNTDGSLDATFNSGVGASGAIRTTAVQSDGKILIGGDFTNFNGVMRNRIARLNTNGSLDGVFNPGNGANNIIETVAIQSNGKIIIGGDFTIYNGYTGSRVTRINEEGSIDVAFNPGMGASYTIFTTAIQSDGKIIIGGDFIGFNGIERNRVARLNADGSLDLSFNPGTGANFRILASAIQSDGKIIIGGDFTNYNGTSRNRIARLNANGSLDVSFNPGSGAIANIHTIAIQSNGKIIIGGDFTYFNGAARKHIARLNTDGSIDPTFNVGANTGANAPIYTIGIQSDGKVIIGGNFSGYNALNRNHIARLNADGTLDGSFSSVTGTNNNIYTLAIQNDGKIIIGGDFSLCNTTSRNRIARLNPGGTIDATFNPGSGASSAIRTVVMQSDGKILIAGDFMYYNGTYRRFITPINPDGSLDITFDPGIGPNGSIKTVAIQNDGKIILAFNFSAYNGTGRNRIARLLTSSVYNFIGAGDWSNPMNWSNNAIPPVDLPAGGEIQINPIAGAECILDYPQTISSGGKISVINGKTLKLSGNLIIQ